MTAAGTVLAIDDDPQSLRAMRDALAPLGFEVLEAGDGETGLALARDRQPDVVLLDVMMPGLDGFEVCRRLQAGEETRLLPVVFLTGLDSRAARLRGLAAGATDFLTKPCSVAELELRVRNLVSFRRMTQDLDDAERMLFAVARAVEARDGKSGEHCDRVAHFAGRLAAHMGLPDEDAKTLRRAGYLHDIGTIGIPDSILLKPGRLDEREWRVIRSHVEIGVEICSPLRTLRSTCPVIRHHHERRDGSGYPDGLEGEAIPRLAQVFQVVDVFDALTSRRPFREALTSDRAFAVLGEETERGWWNPEVVRAFASMDGRP